MDQVAFHRLEVLLPLALDVDEGPLTPAKTEVLDARQREQLFVSIPHRTHNFSMISTPAGTSRSTVTR